MVAQKTRVLFVLSLFLLGVAFEVNAQTINSVEPNFDLQQYSGGWSAGGNATYMTRLNPADVPIFVGGGGTTLSANELDFDFSPGYEAFIATSFEGGGKIEFKFSSLENVSASTSSFAGSSGDSIATSPPTPIFATPVLSTLSLESEMISGEFNMHIPLGLSTDWTLGFRWMEYDEMMIWNRPVSPPVTISTDVDNYMYGIQTGLDVLLTADDISEISIYGKGGAYLNRADQNSRIAVRGIAPVTFSGRSVDTDVAAVVDFGIKGKLYITGNIALNYGYTGLYMAGVALAPDQLGTHTSVLPFPGFVSSRVDTSSAFYHGGFLCIYFNN